MNLSLSGSFNISSRLTPLPVTTLPHPSSRQVTTSS